MSDDISPSLCPEVTKEQNDLRIRLSLWDRLTNGKILGVVDSNGVAHSMFTGDEILFHSDYWPNIHHCRWRWSLFTGIEYWSRPEKSENAIIRAHLEKKYSIPQTSTTHACGDFIRNKVDSIRAVLFAIDKPEEKSEKPKRRTAKKEKIAA